MNAVRELKANNIKFSDKGFTLVELLIVIAIIAILSGLLMVNFIGVRQRARDAQRKSDLRQIQSALEIYRSDNGSYPTGSIDNCSGAFGVPPVPCATIYLQKIPNDPLGTGASNWNSGSYYYNTPDSGSTYTLGACLENKSDGDVDNDTPNSPSGSSTGCTSLKFYVLHNP